MGSSGSPLFFTFSTDNSLQEKKILYTLPRNSKARCNMKKLFVALLILLSFIAISCDGNLNNPGNASEENIPAVSEDDKTQINEMRQEEKKALAKDYIIDFLDAFTKATSGEDIPSSVLGMKIEKTTYGNYCSLSGFKGEKGQYWGYFKYIEEKQEYPSEWTIKTESLTFKLSFVGNDIFGGNSSASDVKINGEKVCDNLTINTDEKP